MKRNSLIVFVVILAVLLGCTQKPPATSVTTPAAPSVAPEASEILNQVIGTSKQAFLHTNQGITLIKEGKFVEAVSEFTKAIDIDPKYANAYANRGVAYARMNQRDLAMADYNKAIELSTDSSLTQFAKEGLNKLGQSPVTAQVPTQAVPKPNGGTGVQIGTTGRVTIFPSSATIELEAIPSTLSFSAMVDGRSIGVDDANTWTNKQYSVQWSIEGIGPISSEVFLNKDAFLGAIGNNAGTYTIKATVTDRETNWVGSNFATVIAKKKQFIPTIYHWVSAVPGKGWRQWESNVNDYRGLWYESDVDLRVEGNTGSITFTFSGFSPEWIPPSSGYFQGMIGQKDVYPIKDWKDNGTTIVFTFSSESQVWTVQLTRAPNRLTGSAHCGPFPIQYGVRSYEATVDLVPAP